VFNAKVNIQRRHKQPIFLGIQESEIGAFQVLGKEAVATSK
jgi:hypothetical protein